MEIQNNIQDALTQKPCSIKASVRPNSVQDKRKIKTPGPQAKHIIPQSRNLFTCSQSTKNSQADSLGPRTSGSETQARDRTTSSQEPHSLKPIHISGTSQGICLLCHYYKHSVRCSRSQIISATRRIRAAPPEHAISSQELHSVEPITFHVSGTSQGHLRHYYKHFHRIRVTRHSPTKD